MNYVKNGIVVRHPWKFYTHIVLRTTGRVVSIYRMFWT